MAHGADLKEFKISHPTLGDRSFDCKSNEGSAGKGGGLRKTSDENGITGSGKAIYQLAMTRWSKPLTITGRSGDGDDLYLRSIAATTVEGTCTFSYVDDVVEQAKGTIVDNWEFDSNTGTATITLEGGGEIKIL